MRLKKTVLTLLLTTFLFSQSETEILPQEAYYQKVQFLIVKSTKDYKEAKKIANSVSKKLNIPINLRGLKFHPLSFLTFDKTLCNKYQIEFPCYLPRGRYDEGEYISIEHSNHYKEFKNGYYIVVVATGLNVSRSLKKVKTTIKDTYIKSAKVYMGSIF